MDGRGGLRRRRLLAAAVAMAAGGCAAPADPRAQRLQDALAELERRHGGRLGVAVLETGTMAMAAHRGGERYAMCSTFKLLAAGAVLARVDRGQESPARRVVYGAEALVPYSPATQGRTGPPGMSVSALCEAALTLSDNTAANLLLDSLGGPAGLTAWLRGIGDPHTRLDRREPDLNQAAPGDERDTTTPEAMVRTLHALLLGGALAPASVRQLGSWLESSRTGGRRLRAGVPAGWRVGDKTGSGGHANTHDVAAIWPPGRAPLLVAAYYAESPAPDQEREAVLAEVGRLAVSIRA